MNKQLKPHWLRCRVAFTFNVRNLTKLPVVLVPRFALIFLAIAIVTELELSLPGGAAMAAGAKNAYQGVYVGIEERQDMAAGNGIIYKCPTRVTIMPDGRSIIVSVQLPYGGILNEVIEGNLNGNLFSGASRGRFNGFNYVLGFNYWIRFVGNQARMTARPVNPQFAGGGTRTFTFYRVRS